MTQLPEVSCPSAPTIDSHSASKKGRGEVLRALLERHPIPSAGWFAMNCFLLPRRAGERCYVRSPVKRSSRLLVWIGVLAVTVGLTVLRVSALLQWLILVGVCTHLGCVPLPNAGDYQG